MLKVVAAVIEILSWIGVILSPLLLGGIIGALLYFGIGGRLGIVAGILFLSLGLIAGIWWVYSISKKGSITAFLSKTMASPDVDEAISDTSEKR